MNPLSLLLQLVGPFLVQAIQAEGSVAIAWLEQELNLLLNQFGHTATITPTAPTPAPKTPASASNP